MKGQGKLSLLPCYVGELGRVLYLFLKHRIIYVGKKNKKLQEYQVQHPVLLTVDWVMECVDNYFSAMQQTFSASCSLGISSTVSHRWVSEDLLSEGCCVWLFSFHGCLVGRVGFVRSVKLQERIS